MFLSSYEKIKIFKLLPNMFNSYSVLRNTDESATCLHPSSTLYLSDDKSLHYSLKVSYRRDRTLWY